jgi:hypothetical protein
VDEHSNLKLFFLKQDSVLQDAINIARSWSWPCFRLLWHIIGSATGTTHQCTCLTIRIGILLRFHSVATFNQLLSDGRMPILCRAVERQC